jgi:hypothetical protein
VLGPVLFNIYLTGLRDLLASYDIHHVSYADDLQLMLTTTISGLSAAIEKMENCINGVKDWFASSFLSLNDCKTEFMILGSPPMLRKVTNVVLKVVDVTIKPSSCLRDLGLYIDPSLSFKHHIRIVSSCAFTALRMIARLQRKSGLQHRKLLLHALVLSQIDYCSSTFHKLPKDVLTKIQRVINSAFRFLHSIKKGSSCKDKRRMSGWLDVSHRICYRFASIIFVVLKRNLPSRLSSLLQFNDGSRNLRSNSQGLLQLARARTEIGACSFRCSAPTL